jgi:hypothetical protein
MKSTVHLIYPHGNRISCPDAIGRNLAHRLSRDFNVVLHHWDARTVIHPQPGDRLIGHPHPAPGTIFRRSVREAGWARTIMLCPYAHGDLRQVAAWDTVLPYCDAHLAITGNYWMRTLPSSPFAHWAPRTSRLDLAVDRRDFPPVKTSFRPPGRRRFLYIGNTAWVKNTGYLSALARSLPGLDFAWMGQSRIPITGFTALGPQDFSQPASQRLIAEYDFILTAGFSDANPTVVLEGMAWGLIPICTPQSGYENYPGIPNIPLNDLPRARAVLERMQQVDAESLLALQTANWTLLDEHFTWDRFADQVRAALLAEGRTALEQEPWLRKLRLRWAAARSPYAPWHPLVMARSMRNRWRGS